MHMRTREAVGANSRTDEATAACAREEEGEHVITTSMALMSERKHPLFDEMPVKNVVSWS
jgi:hypothetical protein